MLRPDSIDSRSLLRWYRWLALAAAVAVLGYRWPVPVALSRVPMNPSTLWSLTLMVLGMSAVLSAGIAHGFSQVEHAERRRRLLRLFAAALIFAGLVCFSPAWPVLRILLGSGLPWVPVAVGAVMVHLSMDVPRFRRREPAAPQPHDGPGVVFHDKARLRSQYEEQIRQSARQEERARLARDLHDAVKQQLFVIQTAAATTETRFETDPAGARVALAELRTAARDALTEMEVMLEQLQATALSNAGLIDSLKRQCEVVRFRTDAEVTFHADELPPDAAFPPGAHQAMLRFAQEALANVARHARARHVYVSLGVASGAVTLAIKDDGQGFDVTRPRSGMGLTNMAVRAAEAVGAFSVLAQPGRGATVSLTTQTYTPNRDDYARLALASVGWTATCLFMLLISELMPRPFL